MTAYPRSEVQAPLKSRGFLLYINRLPGAGFSHQAPLPPEAPVCNPRYHPYWNLPPHTQFHFPSQDFRFFQKAHACTSNIGSEDSVQIRQSPVPPNGRLHGGCLLFCRTQSLHSALFSEKSRTGRSLQAPYLQAHHAPPSKERWNPLHWKMQPPHFQVLLNIFVNFPVSFLIPAALFYFLFLKCFCHRFQKLPDLQMLWTGMFTFSTFNTVRCFSIIFRKYAIVEI